MKKLKSSILLLCLFVFVAFAQEASTEEYHHSRVLVKLKAGTTLFQHFRNQLLTRSSELTRENMNPLSPEIRFFLKDQHVESIIALKPDASLEPLPGGVERIFVLTVVESLSVHQAITSLGQLHEIEYAEPDFVGHGEGVQTSGAGRIESTILIPNDPEFSLQWGMRNTGQTIGGFTGTPGVDINIVPAWDVTTGNASTILAVLDSGIPLTASEFSGRIMQGYDYANNDNDPTDDHGHGTNVASVAAAAGNNNSLLAGVNWQCRILPYKILNSSNSGLYSWWASALIAAADSGADVINMSVGGSSNSSTLQNAITYAANSGSIIVACMMNNNNAVPYYPAAYSNVIAIGAINNRNQRAVPFCWGGGSSYGSHIDLNAPGEYILGLNYLNPNAGISYWCGTSQATPLVSGIVSLMVGLDSTLTFQNVYDKLRQSAHDQVGPPSEDSSGFDQYFGWGRVDAYGAIQAVLPVQLVSFAATVTSSHQVSLEWRTLSEINNYGFEVERNSAMLLNSFTPGHGTTIEPHNYSFLDSTAGSGNLMYRLKQIDLDGTIHYSEPISVSSLTSVKNITPIEFALEQCYPNPFNPRTTIKYQLPERSRVTLKVFDVMGREVALLVNEVRTAGSYTETFDASALSSGTYFYRLESGMFAQSKKMLIMK
jgi:thermitase